MLYCILEENTLNEGQKLQQAIDEAYEKKLIGKNASDIGWDFDIYIHYGAGAYICGEETALLESLEGNKRPTEIKTSFSCTSWIIWLSNNNK